MERLLECIENGANTTGTDFWTGFDTACILGPPYTEKHFSASVGFRKVLHGKGEWMHELSVAMSVLDQVEAAAEREGVSHVASVRLRIGRLSGIACDALRFSWDLARCETVAADAALIIDEIAVAVYCAYCEAERAPLEGAGLTCSVCGRSAPSIVHGRELEIVAMEVAA